MILIIYTISLGKMRNNSSKDVTHIRQIKDKDGKVLRKERPNKEVARLF